MSPKPPVRPKAPKSPDEEAVTVRDLTLIDLLRLPVNLPDVQPGQVPKQPLPQGTHPAVEPPATVEIIDLPADTHIKRVPAELPMSSFFLPPRIVERLPDPDPQTGFRSIISGRQYVDLVDGATVHLGHDAQGHVRAKLLTELTPSGPRLERVDGTSKWRRVEPESLGTGESELTLSRRRVADDEPSQPDPSKRPRVVDEETPSAPQPWANWGIADHHASPEDITIAGVRYKTLPSGSAPDHPIVYIKNPTHLVYDFDLMHSTLRQDLEQQPRGAIQVPPDNRWEIDANLPFKKALSDEVVTYFPELTETSALNIAKEQFSRANGADRATGVGMTTLRQVFNDWKTASITPRADLADPLLMLAVTPFTPGPGMTRKVEMTYLTHLPPLHRLEFSPYKFREQWHFFMTTQSGVDLKRFMASLLVRNGYKVFDPTPAASYPALVFGRTGHDFVFHLSLHRARGNTIPVPAAGDRGLPAARLLEQVGPQALQAVQTAQAAGKLIWLRGGSQVWSGHQDLVFMLRTNDPGA